MKFLCLFICTVKITRAMKFCSPQHNRQDAKNIYANPTADVHAMEI